jgi:succinyl-diaminopimelate desuccinylase
MSHELRDDLIHALDAEADEQIAFLSRFVAAPSPNPPGDTCKAAAYLIDALNADGLAHEVFAPNPVMPNIVASFEGGAGDGPHLVLNGHIDVFPVEDPEVWSKDPWSGEVSEGRIWGRGVIDMKCGTAALLHVYRHLHRLRDHLRGRLTLTCVSDEETVGPWGARWLMANVPDKVRGDVLLSAEATGKHAIYFAERGVFWVKVTLRTPGAHGAYGHTTPSASRLAAALIRDLEELEAIEGSLSDNVAAILERAEASIDLSHGPGTSAMLNKVTVNVAMVNAGIKANMIPSRCDIVLDIRLPISMTHADVLPRLEDIVRRYPNATLEIDETIAPNWCDPDHPLVPILQKNAQALTGTRPDPIVCLGMTDARLWRYAGIPAFVYGSTTEGTAGLNESVEISDYLHVVKTHALTVFDYLGP